MNPTFVRIHSNAPLNLVQRQIIAKPYRESPLACAYAYANETPGIAKKIFLLDESISDNITDYLWSGFLSGDTIGGGIYVFSQAIALEQAGLAATTALQEAALAAAISPGAAFCLGGAIGLVIFEGVIIGTNINRILNSPAYHAWKNQHIKLLENASIEEFIREDDILGNLLCPITGKLPLIPASSMDCITYDYDAACSWIESNPGKPLPGSISISDSDDLTFDFPHINAIIARLKGLQSITFEIKRNRVIKNILGVKSGNSSQNNANDVAQFLFIVQLVHDNGTATLSEMFSQNNPALKKSFVQLDKVHAFCCSLSAPRLRHRKMGYECELMKLDILFPNLNDPAQKNGFKSDYASLIMRITYIKTVEYEPVSPFVQFFMDLFSIKRTVRVCSQADPKLKPEKW
jgi:hypothetical protein